jgi:hypothetical protein
MSESEVPAVLVGPGRRQLAEIDGLAEREHVGMVRSALSTHPRCRVVR